MKVLLIEDDEETSAYVARGLREQGHVVDLAATGRDGLFLATEGGHDVLIVDRMLPGLDGVGLVQALRGTGGEGPGAVPDGTRRRRRPRARARGGRRRLSCQAVRVCRAARPRQCAGAPPTALRSPHHAAGW